MLQDVCIWLIYGNIHARSLFPTLKQISALLTCKYASAMMKITLFPIVGGDPRGEECEDSEKQKQKKALSKLNFLRRAKKPPREELGDPARHTSEGRNFYEEKWVMELFKQN